VVKVEVFVYDKVFRSSTIPKATTLVIQVVESKVIMEQLTEFNKILDDLENIEVHLEDAGALVVSCWEDEEGDVSHLVNDAL